MLVRTESEIFGKIRIMWLVAIILKLLALEQPVMALTQRVITHGK
jgi:hypothetical protein